MLDRNKERAKEYILENLSDKDLTPKGSQTSSFAMGGVVGALVTSLAFKSARVSPWRKPWHVLAGGIGGAISLNFLHGVAERARENLRRERQFFMEQKRAKFLGVREDQIEELEKRINNGPKEANSTTRGIVEYEWVEVDNDDGFVQNQSNTQ